VQEGGEAFSRGGSGRDDDEHANSAHEFASNGSAAMGVQGGTDPGQLAAHDYEAARDQADPASPLNDASFLPAPPVPRQLSPSTDAAQALEGAADTIDAACEIAEVMHGSPGHADDRCRSELCSWDCAHGRQVAAHGQHRDVHDQSADHEQTGCPAAPALPAGALPVQVGSPRPGRYDDCSPSPALDAVGSARESSASPARAVLADGGTKERNDVLGLVGIRYEGGIRHSTDAGATSVPDPVHSRCAAALM
jgi:hypothetical protein